MGGLGNNVEEETCRMRYSCVFLEDDILVYNLNIIAIVWINPASADFYNF